MFKKLVVASLVAATAFWWLRSPEPETTNRHLVFNRIWIDHMPQNERDPFHVFAVWRPESQGAFGLQERWHGEQERFRFEVEGDAIHIEV